MSTKIDRLLPSKTKDMVKVLKSMGYEFSHQKGSHMTYKHKLTGLSLPPLVDCKEQSPGTKRNICKIVFPDYQNL